jgi:hypothetical protein
MDISISIFFRFGIALYVLEDFENGYKLTISYQNREKVSTCPFHHHRRHRDHFLYLLTRFHVPRLRARDGRVLCLRRVFCEELLNSRRLAFAFFMQSQLRF